MKGDQVYQMKSFQQKEFEKHYVDKVIDKYGLEKINHSAI